MDKQALLELLQQVQEQTGDWRVALDQAVELVEDSITTERRTGSDLIVETSDDVTDILVFVTGTDEKDARESLIWEDEASAQEAAEDAGGLNVYNVTARIDWDTLS